MKPVLPLTVAVVLLALPLPGAFAGPPTSSAPAVEATSDLSWLLEFEGRSTNALVWDERLMPLVKSGTPKALHDCVLSGLGGPPDPVFVTSGQFVAASASVYRDWAKTGFLWVDTRSGEALGGCYDGKLTLGSLRLPPRAIPEAARRAVVDWLTEHDATPGSVSFVGPDGRPVRLSVASFMPRVRYRPPKAGPSFDCSRASTTLERTICSAPGVAQLDLDLWHQYSGMLRGYATTVDRQALRTYQSEWIQERDRACDAAADAVGCLARWYRDQQQRLRDWAPRRPPR